MNGWMASQAIRLFSEWGTSASRQRYLSEEGRERSSVFAVAGLTLGCCGDGKGGAELGTAMLEELGDDG